MRFCSKTLPNSSDGLLLPAPPALPPATPAGDVPLATPVVGTRAEKGFKIHAELEGGLNNQIVGVARAILMANATGSQFVLPCMHPDALHGPRCPFSDMFDQEHFISQVWQRYGVKVVDMQCGTSSYDAYTSNLPRIDALDPVASLMFGEPPNGTVLEVTEFVLTNPFMFRLYELDFPLFVGTLRPSPRLGALTHQIVSSLRDKAPKSTQDTMKHWCGFAEAELKVIGLHLKTADNLLKGWCIQKGLEMEVCAPNATTVATYVCTKFGVPCERLIVYVATGSARNTYLDVFSSYFYKAFDKHDVFGNVTALNLGFFEFALVEEFVLVELDLYIGTYASSMTKVVNAMREVRGKRATLLSYTPAALPEFCRTANQAFFKRGGCAPLSADSPCFIEAPP
jgi:hypothetical protein